MITIEMKLIGLWILICITLVIHHFMVMDMIKNKLEPFIKKMKELEDKIK